jgi:hypothetical protein
MHKRKQEPPDRRLSLPHAAGLIKSFCKKLGSGARLKIHVFTIKPEQHF